MRAQETAVTGAQLTVVEKPAAQLEVTIEDRRESALVEWELRRRVRPGA